ncbi:response regulator [Paraburkholderia sp. Tr-20389]|uniref:ATP-binding protein n=1 Tax=Paraburkholderia sp. Tr-20389 TaxID=2703903 RepID=UPI00197D0118|nr:ATP-binding protein [Paraburkholderia sp. Tr-20389]MBN3753634.1 response regulator [Paraburkholderia sp. Tr-20389]
MSKLIKPIRVDSGYPTGSGHALPSRNFARTRRVLLFMLVVTVIVPIAGLAGYGYYNYQQRYNDAVESSERMSRVGEEQALKVMDLNAELVSRVEELLGDMTDARIAADESALHQRLSRIAGGFPQVAAISSFGPSGRLLVSSRFFPAPAVNIRNRDDFLNARQYQPESYVSLPMQASVSKASVFNVTDARVAADGRFLGVVSVALRRDYFSSFYQKLIDAHAATFIGLYRSDGSLLTSFPADSPGTTPQEANMFAQAFSRNESIGHLVSTTFADGQKRVVTYRRVDNYGLYVAVGFQVAQLYAVWLHHFLLICTLTGLPCLIIWLLIGFSLKQLSTEESAWEQWRDEAGRRLDAEESARHLQRASALGNLVASVAHDFNNYLMVVKSNVAIAKAKEHDDAHSEIIAIERATGTVEGLVRTLMGSARKQPLKLTPVDLTQLLPGMLQVVQATVGDSVSASIDVAPDIWPVRSDTAELELAIVNLALNARDAIHHGGKFAVRAQNIEVASHVVGVPAGDYVLLSISDDGEGMSREVADKAFEPLFTTKGGTSHPGLGLVQVLAVCEMSGGTAKLTSERGVGTTVRLYLPRSSVRVEPAADATDNLPAAASTETANHHVLLIEDNDEVAASLSAVLQLMGHEVTHLPSADDALIALQEGQAFELVLSDVQMPGKMSGIDLAEWLLTHRPEQRLALMTGYADELERARHTGVPIFSKPFDAEELEPLIGA